MYCVQELDVIGDRTEAPYARVVKHLVAPWNAGSSKIWMGITIVDPGSASNPHAQVIPKDLGLAPPPGRKGLIERAKKMADLIGIYMKLRKYS